MVGIRTKSYIVHVLTWVKARAERLISTEPKHARLIHHETSINRQDEDVPYCVRRPEKLDTMPRPFHTDASSLLSDVCHCWQRQTKPSSTHGNPPTASSRHLTSLMALFAPRSNTHSLISSFKLAAETVGLHIDVNLAEWLKALVIDGADPEHSIVGVDVMLLNAAQLPAPGINAMEIVGYVL
jgi:hypothetical protein